MNNLLIDNKSKCKTDYKTNKQQKKNSKQWWLFQEVGLVKTLEFVNLETDLWSV